MPIAIVSHEMNQGWTGAVGLIQLNQAGSQLGDWCEEGTDTHLGAGGGA